MFFQEIPILFTTDMVQAILAGKKHSTIRPAGHTVSRSIDKCDDWDTIWPLLYVRENFLVQPSGHPIYQADNNYHEGARYQPSIHMPKWMSRLWLPVGSLDMWVPFSDLDEEAARADGFDSLAELTDAYESHYGTITPQTQVDITRWEKRFVGPRDFVGPMIADYIANELRSRPF